MTSSRKGKIMWISLIAVGIIIGAIISKQPESKQAPVRIPIKDKR